MMMQKTDGCYGVLENSRFISVCVLSVVAFLLLGILSKTGRCRMQKNVSLKIYSFVSFSGSLAPHTFHDSTEFSGVL